jgi:hypothetical protein
MTIRKRKRVKRGGKRMRHHASGHHAYPSPATLLKAIAKDHAKFKAKWRARAAKMHYELPVW